ncbi:unnamed protein product [Linum tenue]|uniref:Uncharacterized protein n=1 Tax=Linum tenue TaxID=586396 RepID=A0AAV0HLF1_9ROSI|nr:unnamed protein product [Linum tenue]
MESHGDVLGNWTSRVSPWELRFATEETERNRRLLEASPKQSLPSQLLPVQLLAAINVLAANGLEGISDIAFVVLSLAYIFVIS